MRISSRVARASRAVVGLVLASAAGGVIGCGGTSTAGARGETGPEPEGTSTPSSTGGDGNGSGSAADGGSVVTVEEDGGSATTDGGTAPPVDAGSGSPRKSHPPTTAPTKTCSGKLDANGNFPVTSPAGTTYWVGLPTGYVKTKAYPVIIVTHGCDDTAENFCSWGPAAYTKSGVQANDKLQYIALSVEDVSGACWQLAASDKVLDALDDAAACFYVDQDHVTMGGYSSGAAVAYKVGLGNAERFSGILIEDGALYDNGAQEAPLLANADWKINIAHIAHISDPVYPEQKVKDDWAVIEAAGFPLKTFIVPGTHDGTSTDWGDTLDPLSAGWAAP